MLRAKLEWLQKSKQSKAATAALSRATRAKGLDSPIAEAANRDLWVESWIQFQMSQDYLITMRDCDDLRAMARTPRK